MIKYCLIIILFICFLQTIFYCDLISNSENSINDNEIIFSSNIYGYFEIFSIDSLGDNLSRLTINSSRNHSPKWSPSGDAIAFISIRDGTNKIYLMDPDGRNLFKLTTQDFWFQSISWSLDGDKICFDVSHNDIQDIGVINRDGSNFKIITNTGGNHVPKWSPDGNRILFQHVDSRNKLWEIYIIDYLTNDQTLVTSQTEFCLPFSWTNNGQEILFAIDEADTTTYFQGQLNNLYLGDVNGSYIKQITNSYSSKIGLQISPNGNEIAFLDNISGNYNIYTMNIDGSNIQSITNNNYNDNLFNWGPDGEKIYFSTMIDGFWRLFFVDVNEKSVHQLTFGSWSVFGADWRPKIN